MRMRSRPDLPVIRPPARAAAVRARIFALLRFSLLFWACSYFALVAISGHTYLRSIAFGLAQVFALWLILGALFSDGEPIPVPDWYLWAALCRVVGLVRGVARLVAASGVYEGGIGHRDRLGNGDRHHFLRRRSNGHGVPRR